MASRPIKPRLGLKPKANSVNQLKQVVEILEAQMISSQNSTRFNGFELLAWDFNPRWAMGSQTHPRQPNPN
jgi:hypothetical protein